MPGEGHEDPTEAQIRWQVFQAIAYGAKGLLYFAFHPFGVGLPGGLVHSPVMSRTMVRTWMPVAP